MKEGMQPFNERILHCNMHKCEECQSKSCAPHLIFEQNNTALHSLDSMTYEHYSNSKNEPHV